MNFSSCNGMFKLLMHLQAMSCADNKCYNIAGEMLSKNISMPMVSSVMPGLVVTIASY